MVTYAEYSKALEIINRVVIQTRGFHNNYDDVNGAFSTLERAKAIIFANQFSQENKKVLEELAKK